MSEQRTIEQRVGGTTNTCGDRLVARERPGEAQASHAVRLSREPGPLFIPLKNEYFNAFLLGTKNVEYRRYGRGWNERTCRVGRGVVLSRGYGKHARLLGVITSFRKRRMQSKAWIDCYGAPGLAACIGIKVLT